MGEGVALRRRSIAEPSARRLGWRGFAGIFRRPLAMIVDTMRPLFAVAALSLLVVLAGCVPRESAGPGHPNPIIVRQFAVSPGVIALDPSFGFSLYRGSPGVPPQQRAAAVGRAAAFSLADAIVEQLTGLGYDAIRSDTAAAEPGGRALIVSGAFSHIDEGHRRQNASVAVDVEVDFQAAAGRSPQRLTTFRLDSRRIRREPLTGVAARHGANVNAASIAIAREIARYTADLARLNKWPGAR